MVMQAKSPVMPITERCPPIRPKRCGCLAFSHSLILNQPRKCSQNKVSYTFIRNCDIKYVFVIILYGMVESQLHYCFSHLHL